MNDPMKPSVILLCKLGSIAVHTEEALSPNGHPYDFEAVNLLLADVEVQDWIKEMGVFLPKKR